MKKRILVCLFTCIMMLTITGCGEKNNKPADSDNKVDNTTDNNTNSSNDVVYSKCAKAGNQCDEKDILEGQLVKVALNSKETEEFYVIADNGTELTLIMNGIYNIQTPWVSSDDIKNVCEEKEGKECGPYTATKAINEATKGWTNISNIKDYSYNVNVENATPHYKSLEIKDGVTTITGNSGKVYTIPGETKARLVTADEISKLKDRDWLRAKVAELYDSKQIKHFYVLTATPSYGGYDGTVQTISCKYNTNFYKINVDNELVVMPVITVKKTDIK